MATPAGTPPTGRLAALQARKQSGGRFSVLTCYDAATARIMAAAGVEVLLVGDTAGEVILGLAGTREVPAEFMLALTAAVRRGAPQSFVMADLPFVCRQGTAAETVAWCRRFASETGCDAIKIEVTGQDASLIEAVASAGIPVVAHLGLLPQSLVSPAGYRAQARDAASACRLIAEAADMEQAGAVMLLLEAVASEVAAMITSRSQIPVIGCVSGPHCDATVVVLHDMLGWGGGHPPRSVRRYANLAAVMAEAFEAYAADVRAGRFPAEEESIHMLPGEHQRLRAMLGDSA